MALAVHAPACDSAGVSEPPTTGGSPERLSTNALERRVKRWWLGGPYEAYVQVAPGLESVLASEMMALKLGTNRAELGIDRGGVSVNLEPAEVMRANLSLRTASRVLLRLGTFPAASVEMLYDRARRLPWEVHLGFHTSYSLRVSARGSKLQAGDEVANTVTSAVSRHMRELGLFPKPADKAPLEFHVRLLNDYCTISLDTSGELLHKRGVRRHVHAAPLRETLAAAMVLMGLQGFDPEVLIDPFCGSGTVLLEAQDALLGLPPGRGRSFAFQEAAWFRPGRWRAVQREAAGDETTGEEAAGEEAASDHETGAPPEQPPKASITDAQLAPRLLGFDHQPKALDAALLNLAQAPYGSVQLSQADSTRLDFGAFGIEKGLIVSNLPYGVRLGEELSAAATAERFLTQLVASGVAWRVALLTTPAEAEIAQRLLNVDEVLATRNGGLDVRLVVGSTY